MVEKIKKFGNTLVSGAVGVKNAVLGQAQLLTMGIPALAFLQANPVFADAKVDVNGPQVGSDGSVTYKGKSGDATKAVGSLMKNGQFWIGVVAGVAGLILIGFGIWYGMSNSREIQKGNSDGWSGVGKVVAGTIIGGIMMAIIGTILAVGAATGNKVFG